METTTHPPDTTPAPPPVPEWRRILDEINLDEIKTFDDACRVLNARFEEWRARYEVEHGNRWENHFGFDGENETLDRRRQYNSARNFRTQVSFGGNVVFTEDLPPDVQPLIWRSLVEHGDQAGRWPDDVQAKIRNAPKRKTHAELYDQRRRLLTLEHNQCAALMLKTHGANPAAWPVEALDEIARHAHRVEALAALHDVASRADVSWHTRKP